MGDTEYPEEDRDRLYRDVWGSEPSREGSRRGGPPLEAERAEVAPPEGGPYTPFERGWEPGGRLRALELEVRELRTAVQSLQRSMKGSIGALRSSIRQLTAAMGVSPPPEASETEIGSAPLPPLPLPRPEPGQGREAR